MGVHCFHIFIQMNKYKKKHLYFIGAFLAFFVYVNVRSIRSTKELEPSYHSQASIPTLLEPKFNIDESRCSCQRSKHEPHVMLGPEEESTCSDFATQRGKNQKVISYSWYNPQKVSNPKDEFFKKYLRMMYGRLNYVKDHMPDWIVRVYHNASTEDSPAIKYMCNLFCTFHNVDFCNVTSLPTLGNLYKKQPIGRLWRFAVMGDPSVSIFLSRDTDSYLLDREIVAVKEWLNSTKEFHVMRDHPWHKQIIFAGLWGGRNNRRKELAALRDQMFAQSANYQKTFDQALLATYVWPFIQSSVLEHTSYFCQIFPNAIPFSTKREKGLYVGWGPHKKEERFNLLNTECPLECRHKKNRSWKYC